MAGFTIPSSADAIAAGGVSGQAQVDPIDLAILTRAYQQIGVVTGGAVTAQSVPNMTVAVASGLANSANTPVVIAASNVTIGAAHATLERYDLVVASAAGALSAVAGTSASVGTARFPTPSDGYVVLAAVYVPPLATSITTGRIVDKRTFIKAPQLFFDPRDYGALANTNGTTGNGHDDTTAINNAAAAAVAAGGMLYFPPLPFRTTAAVTIGDCDVASAPGATIYADHDGNGITAENTAGTHLIFWRRMHLPRVAKVTQKWRLGTDPGSIGVLLVNLTDSEVVMPRVEYFNTGVRYASRGVRGNAYNTYKPLYIWECKVSEHGRPFDSGGWVNENHYGSLRNSIAGGAHSTLAAAANATSTNIKVVSVTSFAVGQSFRLGGLLVNQEYQEDVVITGVGTAGAGGTGIDFTPALALDHKTGEAVVTFFPGTRGILIEEYPGAGGANNNTWSGCSLEGDYWDAKIEINNGADNRFHDMRWECSLSWAKVLLSGTTSNTANQFLGGYDSAKIWLAKTGSVNFSSRDRVDTKEGLLIRGQPGFGNAVLRLGNHSSSSQATILGEHAGFTGINQWGFRIAANLWELKGPSDLTPRVRLDPINGRIGVGTGAGVASSYVVGDTGSSANTSGQALLRIHDASSFVADKAILVAGSYYAVASISGQYLTLATNLTGTITTGASVVQVESTTVASSSASGQPVVHLTDATGFVAGRAINVNGTLYSIRSASGNDITLTINLGSTYAAGVWVVLWGGTLENSAGTIRQSGMLAAEGGVQIGGGTRIYGHLSGTKTWDPANTASGAMTSTTVTVTGAAVGDTVAVGFSIAVPAGCLLTGAVTAANTVTVTMFNISGGAVDLASGTLRADVWQH